MHLVQIDPCLADEIVESNHIFVPNLNSKNVRVHILRFCWVEDWKLETVVEATNWSACPMDVGFLEIAFPDEASDEDIVGFHLLIFVYTVFGAPDNDSEFVFVPWGRSDLDGRINQPIFLINQVDPGLQPSLGANTKLRVKVSQLDRFLLKKMPLLNEITIFDINFSVANHLVLNKAIANASN